MDMTSKIKVAKFVIVVLSSLVLLVILVSLFLRRQHDGAGDFIPGQLVRHRIDGRMGIVISNSRAVQVRFSCHYTSPGNYEVFDCEPFELVKLTEEDEDNLYWRRRERPPHSPDQTELP